MNTPAELEERGREVRKATPRSAHAAWDPGSDRSDPIEILRRQDESRVADLVPLRHERMGASAFTFYRGTAAVMAADLALMPRTSLDVQLCGDAHLSNFGVFAAPDRRLIFDINDFDETLPGPFEWDVKRLAASFEIAGRDRGFKASERREAVSRTSKAYRVEMRRLAGMRTLDSWYERVDLESIERYRSQVSAGAARAYEKNLAKAESKNSLRAFSKLTEREDGQLRIAADPPVIVPVEEIAGDMDPDTISKRFTELVGEYRETLSNDVRHVADEYRYVHAARKVVGVGSVGTRAWIILLLGRDDRDPLFLQVKEAGTSVLEEHLGPSRYRKGGRRVVEGQRLMQAASDIFLGWLTAEGPDGTARDFYVRQLWDGKGSAQIERMDPSALRLYAELCGRTLARAHARSGNRIAIAAYLGKGNRFDHAMTEFADAYADQNEQDFKRFVG